MATATLDSVLHWLLRTALEGSTLILVVLTLRRMLGVRLSPPWRMALWLLVGLKLMLPACIPSGAGLGGWLRFSEPAKRVTQAVFHQEKTLRWSEGVPAPIIGPTAPVQKQRDVTLLAFLSNLVPEPRPGHAVLFWLAGSLTIIATALLRQRRLERLLQTRPLSMDSRLLANLTQLRRVAGVERPVDVVLMLAGTTPAVVGIRYPRILLPEDWQTRFDERELRHVLLHELVHVRRQDLIWNWLALALHALHWFNPMVWLAVARFQADCELRCDARVLELLEPRERLHYGRTLLRIQETLVFAPPATAGLAPCVRNHPSLHQRITMIAQSTHRRPWLLQPVLTLLVTGLACYSFSTARAEREDESPTKVRSPERERSVSRETETDAAAEQKTGRRDRESRETAGREGEVRKTGLRDEAGEKAETREGELKKAGPRDGEVRKVGPRDGDDRKTGPRDGEVRKVGPQDGDDRKTGPRDGDGVKKVGPRDGEAAVKKPLLPPGERPVKKPLLPPGEPRVKKPLLPPGERPVKKPASDEDARIKNIEILSVRVIDGGKAVLIGGKEVAMNGLRAHLSEALPGHAGAKVVVTANTDVPYGAVLDTLDAVRDNGAKHATIERE